MNKLVIEIELPMDLNSSKVAMYYAIKLEKLGAKIYKVKKKAVKC